MLCLCLSFFIPHVGYFVNGFVLSLTLFRCVDQVDGPGTECDRLTDDDVLRHSFEVIDLSVHGCTQQVRRSDLERCPCQYTRLPSGDSVSTDGLDATVIGHHVCNEHDVSD